MQMDNGRSIWEAGEIFKEETGKMRGGERRRISSHGHFRLQFPKFFLFVFFFCGDNFAFAFDCCERRN